MEKGGDRKLLYNGRNLTYDDTMVKKYLLGIVGLHKSQYKKYVIDEVARDRGIIVLRLPYCELNLIELILAQVKGYVAKNNKTFKMQEARQLLFNSLAIVSSENWQNAIKHVIVEE